ncbi:HEXXH motif domain-containing protein [Streptomyces aureoverticillatus]|nr:HEXXH motif domain-containing protein [Streptomyces aureoverticillatus]
MPADAPPGGDAGPARRHGLSSEDFDTLAGGGGDTGVLSLLWEAERSHRLLLLDLFLDLLAKRPEALGPLPAADEAWQLLLRAEGHDRAAVEDLLLRPETGLWLAPVLRRLRGEADGAAPADVAPGTDAPASGIPLWADVGQFHALAAAAALRAGIDFTVVVPARHGTVELPSLGRAVLPGTYGRGGQPIWGCAQVTYGKGEVVVTLGGRTVRSGGRGPGVGWEAARTAVLPLSGTDAAVHLDDLGCQRIVPTPASLPPERLSGEEARRWTDLLHEAGPLLADADAQSARDVAVLLRSVEPLPAPAENERLSSATSGDGVGRLASGRPANALQLAAVLAHEIQHSKLAVLMHLYRLYDPDDASLFYVPWRDDPRPLRGVLQGVYAFTAVARFWQGRGRRPGIDEESAAAAHFEHALWRRQLLRVIRDVQQHPGLTHLGRRVIERLRETITAWELPGPARQPSRTMAEDAADHHAMRWRLHHVAPDPTVVRTLARTWPRRLAPLDTGEPQLRPDPDVPHLDTVTALYRLRLTDPGALEKAVGAPQAVTALVPDATGAELLQVLGDVEGALELSTAAVREGPGDTSSWACFALALRGQVLQSRPEVARAVYEAVRDRDGKAPDPVTFTAWLDGLAPMC